MAQGRKPNGRGSARNPGRNPRTSDRLHGAGLRTAARAAAQTQVQRFVSRSSPALWLSLRSYPSLSLSIERGSAIREPPNQTNCDWWRLFSDIETQRAARPTTANYFLVM